MKEKEINGLIRYIVKETLNLIQESRSNGEWWIDESGEAIFADGDVGESNHESVVIQRITSDILSYFEIEEEEPSHISDYEELIFQSLKAYGRLTDEDIEEWEMRGPSEVILKKLIEDKSFGDSKQTEDMIYIAYGSQTRDAREYAMKYWRWKIMRTVERNIEIETWYLKSEDLGIIVRGIWDVFRDVDNDISDVKVSVTVQASGKRFSNIPLAVLEKKMPETLHSYQSGVHNGYTESLNEEFHHLHKEWRLYEGNRHIVALFEDGSKLSFEVHFHNKHREDKDKWRHRAFTTWKSCANEIYNDTELTEAGNLEIKDWKSCFKEALKHPKMKDFIRTSKHQRVFKESETAPIYDPINFTKMN